MSNLTVNLVDIYFPCLGPGICMSKGLEHNNDCFPLGYVSSTIFSCRISQGTNSIAFKCAKVLTD